MRSEPNTAAAIRGAVGRSTGAAAGKAGAKAPEGYQHKFDPKNRLGYVENEVSPRLQHLDAVGAEPLVGAPLLPPTQTESESDERFCVGGPDLGSVGQARRSTTTVRAATLAELTTRFHGALGQAALLLNDRLRALQLRLGAGYTMLPSSETELLEVADALSAASYYVQKWAHLLDAGKTQKPSIPGKCEEVEEAIAMMHYGVPKLMVHGSTAQSGLSAVVKKHGDGAEAKVRGLGIDLEDLRALAPHLERMVMRLGRVASSLQRARSLNEFVVDYFQPRLGRKVAEALPAYIA